MMLKTFSLFVLVALVHSNPAPAPDAPPAAPKAPADPAAPAPATPAPAAPAAPAASPLNGNIVSPVHMVAAFFSTAEFCRSLQFMMTASQLGRWNRSALDQAASSPPEKLFRMSSLMRTQRFPPGTAPTRMERKCRPLMTTRRRRCLCDLLNCLFFR